MLYVTVYVSNLPVTPHIDMLCVWCVAACHTSLHVPHFHHHHYQLVTRAHLQILNQFGDLESDLFEKQRYAVWRAAEIRKALREGREPLPPPAGEQPAGNDADPFGFGSVPQNAAGGTSSAVVVGAPSPLQTNSPSGIPEQGSQPYEGFPGDYRCHVARLFAVLCTDCISCTTYPWYISAQ